MQFNNQIVLWSIRCHKNTSSIYINISPLIHQQFHPSVTILFSNPSTFPGCNKLAIRENRFHTQHIHSHIYVYVPELIKSYEYIYMCRWIGHSIGHAIPFVDVDAKSVLIICHRISFTFLNCAGTGCEMYKKKK